MVAALGLVIAGCATQPPVPPPAIAVRAPESAPNIVGQWTAVATDGVPTALADRFALTFTPTTIEARLCNSLSGGYRLEGPRLVWSGPWRSTERGCFDPTGKRDPMAVEKRIFTMLASEMTVTTPTIKSLRLTGAQGTIDFVRGSPLSHAIVGEWTAVAFDGRPAAKADRFALTVTPDTIGTAGLCNDARYSHYRLADGRIEPDGPPWPRTQRGCGAARDRLEDRAWMVIARTPTVAMLSAEGMRLTSVHGSIDFVRRR